MRASCFLFLLVSCGHASIRSQPPCDGAAGDHPPSQVDAKDLEELLRNRAECSASLLQLAGPPPSAEQCEVVAAREETVTAALACRRSCEATAQAQRAGDTYRQIVSMLREFPERYAHGGDLKCKLSAVSYAPLRGSAATSLWHCAGMPDLPRQMGLEMRVALHGDSALQAADVEYVRVEGPLWPGGSSYLFTYEDVNAGCGQFARLVQVEH